MSPRPPTHFPKLLLPRPHGRDPYRNRHSLASSLCVLCSVLFLSLLPSWIFLWEWLVSLPTRAIASPTLGMTTKPVHSNRRPGPRAMGGFPPFRCPDASPCWHQHSRIHLSSLFHPRDLSLASLSTPTRAPQEGRQGWIRKGGMMFCDCSKPTTIRFRNALGLCLRA